MHTYVIDTINDGMMEHYTYEDRLQGKGANWQI